LETIQNKSETEAARILLKARTAIMQGGYDDLASAAERLAELIKEQNPAFEDNPLSPLVKPLIAIADILAADNSYLSAAIAAYVVAAHYSIGKDDELNKQSLIAILKKAECLSSSADRIRAYRVALKNAPANSSIIAFAKHKAKEQLDLEYFRIRAPKELPRLDEAIVEGDLKAVLGDGIKRVVRQQLPSGDIQYSVVVTRGFSRGKLGHTGIQNALKLRRISADDDLDRIIVPANNLPQHTLRDIDFLSRLQSYGIHLDPIYGRTRDDTGIVNGYKFPEGSNPDRLMYIGIDTHAIIPHDGKIVVPFEKINFFADPALIWKWNWMPAGGGIIRSHVPESERSVIIQSLQAFGIAPGENTEDDENNDYLVVARNDKGRLNNLIQRHALQERSKHLLNFAEALPSFASSIAVTAYKDACSTLFGLKKTR
jgi:hypothetical protein